MPIPDENFNVAKFLYYNPELTAASNVIDNTQAYEWAHSNDTSGMVWNDDSLPTLFNSEAFIIDFKKDLDASSLNRTIQSAMLVEGFTQSALNERARYISTIYQDAMIEEPDVFRFNYFPLAPQDNFSISLKNISVGDNIKLLNTTTKVFEYAIVIDIIDPARIRLSNPRKTYNNIGDTYKVIGIRLYDYVRLAKINYLRGLNPAPEVPATDALGFIDPAFNPDLYRLLYPDASTLTDLKAYYDYVNRRDNNDFRVGRVVDFSLDSNVFSPDVDNLNVNYRLTISPNGALRWGDRYVYGVSDDDVSHSSLLNQSQDYLVTEYAIKKYVDRSYDEIATFNDVVVNGVTQFNGPVDIANRLQVNDVFVDGNLHVQTNASVEGQTILHGGTHILGMLATNTIHNVEITDAAHTGSSRFKTDVYMESNVYIAGYSLGPRIGIGPAVPIDYTATPSGLYDAKLKNLDVRRVLEVGADLSDGEIALKVNGFVQADNIAYVSDARLKNVHALLSGSNALAAIEAIAPISFEYKVWGEGKDIVKKLGFLADDVERVIPEAVSRIALYELSVRVCARVLSDTVIEVVSDEVMELDTGDEIKLEAMGWFVIESCKDQLITLSTPLDLMQIGILINIKKLKVKNVRSIDYSNLVAVMWCALRTLAQQQKL